MQTEPLYCTNQKTYKTDAYGHPADVHVHTSKKKATKETNNQIVLETTKKGKKTQHENLEEKVAPEKISSFKIMNSITNCKLFQKFDKEGPFFICAIYFPQRGDHTIITTSTQKGLGGEVLKFVTFEGGILTIGHLFFQIWVGGHTFGHSLWMSDTLGACMKNHLHTRFICSLFVISLLQRFKTRSLDMHLLISYKVSGHKENYDHQ